MKHLFFAFFLAGLSVGVAFAEELPRFDLPVDCHPGVDCFVQNYVDQDPGPEARDFACGALSYDGHKGTDLRLVNLAAMEGGVAVLAAAPGTVLRRRDGMADVSIRDTGVAAVAGREAGNSVIIDHGGGWVSQYAHLRQGSLLVKPGDVVAAGTPLGQVGLSGETEFPHLHFEVRFQDHTVDPFTGPMPQPACGTTPAPLWSEAAAVAMTYRPSGLLDAGFAPSKPEADAIDRGDDTAAILPADSAGLVFWINMFGLQKGDVQHLRLIGPAGGIVAEGETTSDKNRAREFRFVGKKRPGAAWPTGAYRGEYRLLRRLNGIETTVIEAARTVELR